MGGGFLRRSGKKFIASILLSLTIVIATVMLIFVCFAGDNGVIRGHIMGEATADASEKTGSTISKPYSSTDKSQTPPASETMVATDKTDSTISTMAVSVSTELMTQQATEIYISPTEEQPTEPPTLPTEPPTEPPTIANDTERLRSLISLSGYTLEDIESQNISQLVLVDSYGSQADIYIFSNNGEFWVNENLDCKGYIGMAGTGEKKNSKDNITPNGLYPIQDAFHISEKPLTWLDTFRITENTYWVDDNESDMYNQKVEGEQEWSSAIRMMDFDKYKYGFVIGYNTEYPANKDMGSAVFMECGSGPTSGGIAVSEEMMLHYLNVLNAGKSPHILIY